MTRGSLVFGRDGQTKKKVTIADGRANLMGEKIPIQVTEPAVSEWAAQLLSAVQCTCHYTDEEGYEPKNLVLEVYTRSKGDKTVVASESTLCSDSIRGFRK